MTPDTSSLQRQLRQIDEQAAKGLLRPWEADAARRPLVRRLLAEQLPDTPAPRGLTAGVRLAALAAMAVLVAGLVAWLLWGQAGLKPATVEFMRTAAARARLPASGAHTARGMRIDGRVELARGLRSQVGPDDAVFIVAQAPGDTGLPLAVLRKQVRDLPLEFTLDERQSVGAPERWRGATQVLVSARISRSGAGRPQAGDLMAFAGPVAMGSGGVRIVIDREVGPR